MMIFRWPGDRERARAQRAIRRSGRAIVRNDAVKALYFNRRAEEAVRAALSVDPRPKDKEVLGSLLYNRSTILMAVGDLDGAFEAANRALDVYHALDPTQLYPDAVRAVLAPLQVPAVVTDQREVLRTVLAHKQREQMVEDAIARAADARIRCVRLAALLDDNARGWIENHGKEAVRTYQELVKYGHHYTEADVRRVAGELAAARKELKNPPPPRSLGSR